MEEPFFMQRLLQLVHEQVIWWNGWINGKCLTKAHFLGLAFMRLTSFIKACILSDFFLSKGLVHLCNI